MNKFWQTISKKDFIFGIIILILVVIISFKPSNKVRFSFGEDSVDINTTRYTMNIPYEMVESIEIVPYSEEDEQVRGRSDMALRTGIWQNESWGEYYACLDLQTDTCILVHLNDGRIFVFSHKSDEKVASDFATFQSYLNP